MYNIYEMLNTYFYEQWRYSSKYNIAFRYDLKTFFFFMDRFSELYIKFYWDYNKISLTLHSNRPDLNPQEKFRLTNSWLIKYFPNNYTTLIFYRAIQLAYPFQDKRTTLLLICTKVLFRRYKNITISFSIGLNSISRRVSTSAGRNRDQASRWFYHWWYKQRWRKIRCTKIFLSNKGKQNIPLLLKSKKW